MTTEHKNLEYLKGRFEDGDRPTGSDFARLLSSCHNSRHLTDTTITGALSVQGAVDIDSTINGRDIIVDGDKLDNLDSFVRDNSDSWEETDHILTVSGRVETVNNMLSAAVTTLGMTTSAYIDHSVLILDDKIDSNYTTVDSKIDTSVSTLDDKIDTNYTTVDSKIDTSVVNLSAKIDLNTSSIDTNKVELTGLIDSLSVEIDEIEINANILNTTVADNSASWGVDENTNTLNGLTDVVTVGATHNSVLKYDTTEGLWLPATDLHGEGQHVDTFLELHDTPVAYTGSDEFIKVNQAGDGLAFVSHNTELWDDTTNTVATNSASWAVQTDVTSITTDLTNVSNTVATNSASWAEQTDVTGLTNTVATNSANWSDHTDVTNITTDLTNVSNTVATNSASWAVQTDVTNITTDLTNVSNTVATNSANWSDHTDVTNITTDLTNVSNTVATNSANWSDHTDVTDLTNTVATNSANWSDHTDVTDLTNTVATNSASWAVQTDVTDITTDLTNVSNTVATNSASWAEQTDVTDLVSDIADVTTVVSSNSSSWAVLNSQGKLVESQIPELSITQTYTVQNKEEVTTLNPAEGIQRGDIVIVSTAYDNLIAKVDDPSGVYDQSTKTYSGYSKLSRPDAYVTSVNEMYGNVVIETDDITDQDNTNKWSTAEKNTYISNLSSNFINTTTGIYTSAGAQLHDIFSTSDNIIGDQVVSGESTATFYTGKYKTKDNNGNTLTGITRDVNIGGHVLHIVNGIITGITDE